MPVLLTSDLKKRAGEILDAAVDEPQFIFRAGHVFMLAPVEPSSGARVFPDGYFSNAYPQPPERRKTAAVFSEVRQVPQR
jgi:hypothetical protein